MNGREPPKFTGVATHRDRLGRFSIRYPTDWRTFDISQGAPVAAALRRRGRKTRRGARGRGAAPATAVTAATPAATADEPLPVREGFGFAPDAADPETAFTVWVSPLGASVVAEDLEVLRSGVDAGLEALADCRVERADDDVLSNLVKFERIYTFREREAVRKRKQWLLYVDTWLICLTWQGSSPEAYQHWYAMANQSFLNFELPHALWFATDRDLAGWSRTGTEPAGPAGVAEAAEAAGAADRAGAAGSARDKPAAAATGDAEV
jgi:hypothetical protein